MRPEDPAILSPACPRCGYDQGGTIASWSRPVPGGACPLEGTCAECGLAFRWADVLRTDRRVVPGLYEHARRWRAVGAAWRTWWWAIRPWVFAARVPLHARTVPVRVCLWLPVLLAPLYLAYGVGRTIELAVAVRRMRLDPQVLAVAVINAWTEPGASLYAYYPPLGMGGLRVRVHTHLDDLPSYLWAGVAATAAVPLTLLCLTRTLHGARARPGHVLRCGVYGLAWLGPVAVLIAAAAAADAGAALLSAATGGWRAPWGMLDRLLAADFWLAAPVVAWCALWWWYAIAHVLRLARARLVWTLLMCVAVTAGLIPCAGPLGRLLV